MLSTTATIIASTKTCWSNIFRGIRGSVIHKKSFKRSISNSRSSSSSSIRYFNNEQALNFIISSGGDIKRDSRDDKVSLPRIYSPTLNFDQSKMNIIQLNDDDNNIQKFCDIIESHYTLDNRSQFVGGMGENDGGVWFVNDDDDEQDDIIDTLDYWEEIRNVIRTIKENRHGISFGVYTSGIIKNKDIIPTLKESVGISSVQVTLGAGDPMSYSQVVGRGKDIMPYNEAFGEVCNFIVQAAESGFPVIAAVAGGKHSGPGSELAKALGAIDVVVYKDVV